MRISARIWSGVSIILVGYMLTVMVGAWLGHQSSVKLEAARIAALPATLKMVTTQKPVAPFAPQHRAGPNFSHAFATRLASGGIRFVFLSRSPR
jgi:hypothetical protein